MANCELCGAEKTVTRSVKMGRALVESCMRCIESMGLESVAVPQKSKVESATSSTTHRGYSGVGRTGKDIMKRARMELTGDFVKLIKEAREQRGWDKRELAQRMAEKVNVIQAAESGRVPTDTLVKKLERTLDITLMIEAKADENRQVGVAESRGLTLGDFLDR